MNVQAKATQAVSQLMSLNMLMWLAMLTLFAGVLYLAMALYLAIALVLGPAWAALISGLGLCLLFALMAGGIRALVYSAASVPQETSAEPPSHDHADDKAPSLDDNPAADWARQHPGWAAAGALTAGVALAASPALRRFTARAAGPAVTRWVLPKVRDAMK